VRDAGEDGHIARLGQVCRNGSHIGGSTRVLWCEIWTRDKDVPSRLTWRHRFRLPLDGHWMTYPQSLRCLDTAMSESHAKWLCQSETSAGSDHARSCDSCQAAVKLPGVAQHRRIYRDQLRPIPTHGESSPGGSGVLPIGFQGIRAASPAHTHARTGLLMAQRHAGVVAYAVASDGD